MQAAVVRLLHAIHFLNVACHESQVGYIYGLNLFNSTSLENWRARRIFVQHIGVDNVSYV